VTHPLLDAIARHEAADAAEDADLVRIRGLLSTEQAPWSRDIPLHLTASALVIHPPSARVLLRWHAKQERWLQVGGHADPGESDPWVVALREAEEETGLTDLQPWPTLERALFQAAIVEVAPAPGESGHEHADLRYLLATDHPEQVLPELEGVPLRWLDIDAALELADAGLERLLRRLPRLG
jgi:8-oxo-dGTP pyrophosphatase MutT (NUDIX family)